TLSVLGRGEWFGRIGKEEPLPYTVSAAEPTTAMKLTTSAVERLSQRVQNAIHQALLGSMQRAFGVISAQTAQSTHRLQEVIGLQNRFATRAAESTASFVAPYLAEIPSLPPYANNLAIKLLDETTTPQEVADGIKQDPALAALVLHRVNSPYYSFS